MYNLLNEQSVMRNRQTGNGLSFDVEEADNGWILNIRIDNMFGAMENYMEVMKDLVKTSQEDPLLKQLQGKKGDEFTPAVIPTLFVFPEWDEMIKFLEQFHKINEKVKTMEPPKLKRRQGVFLDPDEPVD